MKNVGSFLNNEMLRLPGDFKYIQWYHFALDSIESKIYKQKQPKFKRKHQKKILLLHSATNLSNYQLPFIFNSINVKSSFVTNEGSFVAPTVIYILLPPFVLNY